MHFRISTRIHARESTISTRVSTTTPIQYSMRYHTRNLHSPIQAPSLTTHILRTYMRFSRTLTYGHYSVYSTYSTFCTENSNFFLYFCQIWLNLKSWFLSVRKGKSCQHATVHRIIPIRNLLFTLSGHSKYVFYQGFFYFSVVDTATMYRGFFPCKSFFCPFHDYLCLYTCHSMYCILYERSCHLKILK